eukprot:TRINITY_DN787_c0_g2_i1.p1 TRINITY_DN787_c0_g2~~TRINITY_DN787_c0_g2_i1.p1  ORF type:complete len:361 (-),score=138.86 TRINITY_DN787_c0_g2_i1:1141-2223(-)
MCIRDRRRVHGEKLKKQEKEPRKESKSSEYLMMYNRNKVNVAVALALLFCMASAWWEAGHMLTAQIAKRELLARNKRVYKIADELANIGADLSYNFHQDFSAISVWADEIKIALTAKKTLTKLTMEKAFLFRFLTHIIGDLHQPLHNAALYNETLLKGDEGGNEFLINYPFKDGRKYKNLHQFWDDGAAALPMITARPFNESALKLIDDLSTEIMDRYPRTHFGEKLTNKNCSDWSLESYENARRYVYGPLDGSNGPAEITEEYVEASGEFVRSQIALGGYRLADLIEEVLTETTENLENTQGFVHKQLRKLKLEMMQVTHTHFIDKPPALRTSSRALGRGNQYTVTTQQKSQLLITWSA